MWDRKEVKAKGKAAFQRNFWLCVLVSLALILPTLISNAASTKVIKNTIVIEDLLSEFSGNALESSGAEDLLNQLNSMSEEQLARFLAENNIHTQEDFENWLTQQLVFGQGAGSLAGTILEKLKPVVTIRAKSSFYARIAEILLFSVIEVGACIFFIRNSKANAQADCLFEGFRSERYGTIVVAKLLRDIFIGLWSLLFLIPGIIKSYEYSMIPYILADHPEVSRRDAFKMSKEMMRGNKWKLFVFDLSFLGWYILNIFTFNLLSYLFINPYKNAAMAELYLAIKNEGLQYQNV